MTDVQIGALLAREVDPPLTNQQMEAVARIVNTAAGSTGYTSTKTLQIPAPEVRRLLGYKMAAAYLGISERTMRQLAADGEVVKIPLSNRALFDRQDLDRLIERKKMEA